MIKVQAQSTEAKLVSDIVASYAVEIQRMRLITNDFTKSLEDLSPQEAAVVCFSAGIFNELGGVLKKIGMEHLVQFIRMEVRNADKAIDWVDGLIDYVNNFQNDSGLNKKLNDHFEEREKSLSDLEKAA